MTKETKLPGWLRSNGTDLTLEPSSNWRCIFTTSGMEVSVAKFCASEQISFFLPFVDSTNGQATLLWPQYVFCRLSMPQQRKLLGNRRVISVLIPPDESQLLEHLRLFSPLNKLTVSYLPGDLVELTTTAVAGIKAKIVGAIDLEGRLVVELLGTSYPIRLTRLANEIRPLRQKFVAISNSEVVYVEEPAQPRERSAGRLSEPLPASGEPVQPPVPPQLAIELSAINEELVKYLHKHPNQLFQMDPRRFELLVAHLLADMGYEVQLTPQSRDGGRDILAALRLPLGETLTIVECKRYAPDNAVGIDIVERFLFTIDRKDNASYGLIATTSSFTEGAKSLESQYRWRLGLRDFNVLHDWLGNYGKWSRESEIGLWVPGYNLFPNKRRY